MKVGVQLTLSFMFLLGSAIVSLVMVHGNYPEHLYRFIDQRINQNFHHSTNKMINRDIIPQYLRHSYIYLNMASFFGRSDIALPGFASYFRKASDRELENANMLMTYLNMRGAMIKIRDIKFKLNTTMFMGEEPGFDALLFALQMERKINYRLLKLLDEAEDAKDVHLRHTLEDKFLGQKVNVIKEYGDNIAVLEHMRGQDYGLGEYEFDRQLA